MTRHLTSLITFLLLIVCRPAGAALESQAAGERVLHFPADRSLGRIQICEPAPETPLEDFYYWIRGEKWEYFAEARGDVSIPAGKWVSLSVERREAWRDLSPLSNLPADALYRLDLHGSYTGGAGMRWIRGWQNLRRLTVPDRIDDAGLVHVAGLSSLTGLYFRENRVTNAGLRHLAGLQGLEELALGGSPTADWSIWLVCPACAICCSRGTTLRTRGSRI